MPVTYTSPIVQPSISTIQDVQLFAGAEAPIITLTVLNVDGAGLQHAVSVQMTPAAFFAAMQAASGTWKNRLYTVALAQIGQTGTIT